MAALDPWFIGMCSRHAHNCEDGPCPGCAAGRDEPCGYCHRRPPVGGSFATTDDGIRICKGCAA